jgi:DNA-binding response OmpR family regulator
LFAFEDEAGVNALELYVHRLRKRLEPAGIRVRTIRGLGYLLERP